MKSDSIVASLWFLVLCLLFIFSAPLTETLWLIAPLLQLAWVALGLVLIVIAIVFWVKRRRRTVFPILLIASGILFFFTSGFRVGRFVLFQIRKDRYETLLREVETTRKICEGEGAIDNGPPLRYVFYWERGVSDNWVGLVYDPSGEVMKANQFKSDWSNWDAPELQEVKSLFGGDMLDSEHVEGPWYICWFT